MPGPQNPKYFTVPVVDALAWPGCDPPARASDGKVNNTTANEIESVYILMNDPHLINFLTPAYYLLPS